MGKKLDHIVGFNSELFGSNPDYLIYQNSGILVCLKKSKLKY
jgi:hypothetical protein